jgi:tetratricopeptide (TPR) repeat protein
MLEEALQRLDSQPGALRARVLARLAAAMQPAEDVRVPMKMAAEAVAMARASGDPETLLFALQLQGSCLMDLAASREREPVNREHVDIARQLGANASCFRGLGRRLIDLWESAAEHQIDEVVGEMQVIAHRFGGHSHFLWRVAAARAMAALWKGELCRAEELIDEAASLAEDSGDPNAGTAVLSQRAMLAYQRGDLSSVAELAPQFQRWFAGTEFGEAAARIISAGWLCLAGEQEEALGVAKLADAEVVLETGDRTCIQWLTEFCLAAQSVELARELLEWFEPIHGDVVTGSMIGMTVDTPVAHCQARLHRFLGDKEASERAFDEALEVSRRLGGAPAARRIAHDRGEAPARGKSAAIEGLEIVKDGETFLVTGFGEQVRMKDTKGMRLLSKLVAEPNREFHVLDLVGAGKAAEVQGDAGEHLDDEAREAYRQRVQELRSVQEEAEANNDLGRAAKAREELDFIVRELSRAVGLSGRSRRAGSAAERARVNVQRRLRDAVKRIATEQAALGRHLERSLKTGMYCVYEPE